MKYKDFPKLLRSPLLNYGLSGKFGNWVFRQQNGRTVFYARYQGPVSNTPAQQKSRSKFRDAVHYANQAMLVPEIKAEYAAIAKKKKKKNVHLLATQYFLKGIHIPLPVPPRVTKYANWEEILREIHQMQSLAPSKRRRRQKSSLGRKSTKAPIPRKAHHGDAKQGKCVGYLGSYNTT